MYLAALNDEKKKLFLGFAYNLASIDGDYSEEEQEMMAGYCHEMSMELNLDEIAKPVDTIIDKLIEVCSIEEKRIIIFEAIGLAMADGNYVGSERELIKMISERFGIAGEFLKQCEDILNEYISYQSRINQLILG